MKRIWYRVDKLLIDEQGFTNALEIPDSSWIVEARTDLQDKAIYVTSGYIAFPPRSLLEKI